MVLQSVVSLFLAFGRRKSGLIIPIVACFMISNGACSLLSSFFQSAYADGLSFENVPPSLVAGKPISLFIKVDPPVLTDENRDKASLQLRLFDPNTNETIQHVTYGVHVIKDFN